MTKQNSNRFAPAGNSSFILLHSSFSPGHANLPFTASSQTPVLRHLLPRKIFLHNYGLDSLCPTPPARMSPKKG
jgi:hypothetical protein